jgi:polyhydroxyalkanoate synthesis regulator phasin
MVRDALRGYLARATGTAGQVSALAEDLITTSRRNRESLVLLVRHEVEQAVKRLGLAPAADVDELTRRVRELERAVRELKAPAHTNEPRKDETP